MINGLLISCAEKRTRLEREVTGGALQESNLGTNIFIKKLSKKK